MKKTISVLLILSVLTVLIINSAFADDFSVRNGIKFGMTIEEVKQIEKNNGVSDDDIYLDEINGDFYCVGLRTSIAGIEGTRVLYQFDIEKHTLVEINYLLGTYDKSREQAESYFTKISQSLKEKYGDPLHSSFSDGLIFPTPSDRMKGTSLLVNVSYYEWVVDFGDYYVLIDSINGKNDMSFFKMPDIYDADVSYKYVTKQEAEEAFQKIEDDNQQTQDETDRDL